MSGPPPRHLWADAHPVRRRLRRAYGLPPRPTAVPARGRFAHLARAITYQQLAGAAAGAIWGRVEQTVAAVEPGAVLECGHDRLRAAGLSTAKATTLLGLAEAVENGVVPLGRLGGLDDDEIVSRLTTVRGIGPWTAHMFLISGLARPDIWPVGDYGVRVGFARASRMDEVPSQREMDALGEAHRPYRTTMALWCWQAVDQPILT